jgi:Putative exonuclease SbcCD, C subunit/P-loop containing region of AAA domain/SMC proteins Flexible Hinge Domain
MMQLRHIAMVNWHLFDVCDLEVAGHIGVLGENRSGKSTVLDMAQVVLTGGNRRFQRLNAVAGDGKGRSASRRSVLDYCLGTLGEDQQRRTESKTYISLGFADPTGERPPVTIGMALEARRADSRETVLALFVAVGALLTTETYIDRRDGGMYPAEWEDVRSRIVGIVGDGNFHNHRDKASDYVREYMRHLVPNAPFQSEQSAVALQKSIVNAMTLDHNQTATEFVRNYILDDDPIRIKELRESIQTYKSISETIRNMREKLEALKALRVVLEGLQECHEVEAREQWIGKRADFLASRALNRDLRDKRKAATAARDAANDELKFFTEEIRGIDATIQRLNEAIAEFEGKSGRLGLMRTKQAAEEKAVRSLGDLRTRLERIGGLMPLCHLRQHGIDAFIPAVERLVEAAKGVDVGRPVSPELAAAEAAVVAEGPMWLSKLDDLRQQLIARLADKRRQRDDMQARIRATGGLRAHIQGPTETLLLRLRQAGMAPRVLCDMVEVADPEWTVAAEGLLGRDRDAVFVDRSQIAEATRIFKEGRRDFHRAALVSLNKLERFRDPPAPGTFPTIFRAQDDDAMAFIMRRYGTVRLAETMAEFERPGRAVMKDGLYDDGLIRTHRSVPTEDYKIGKAAQERTMRLLRDRVEELGGQLETEGRETTMVERAVRALEAICGSPAETLSGLAEAFEQAQSEKSDAEARIEALDGAGDGGLRDKRKAQYELKRVREAERDAQQKIFIKHEGDIIAIGRSLGGGDSMPGSDLHLKVKWSTFLKTLPFYNCRTGRAAYRERLATRVQKTEADKHRTMAEKALADVEQAVKERGKLEREVREALHDYFARFTVSSEIGVESAPLKEVKPWADVLIEDIEANELRKYERQAHEAADKAATLLRGEFINTLTSRIGKMNRDIASLNRSLEDHPFHHERYSFHSTEVVEFKPILKIVDIGKTSPEALDMLFRADVPDDFPHKETIQALEALLEDPEKDFREFEDYRNFFTFEIIMQDVQTGRRTRWEARRGTGSGAEQQVPIYVAIGASLAAVYGSDERIPGKPSGMALAMFDEAFSKMDGKNQRQMMSFYKDLGLQFVIAAPFEKRVAVLEHMDTIVEVDRIGEQSKAEVVLLKEKARRELMAMDPDHMSTDELTARMAAE